MLSIYFSLRKLHDFVVTGHTEYKTNVDDFAAETLHSEHNPDRLFCNEHPTLIFNRVVTQQYSEVENVQVYSQYLHKPSGQRNISCYRCHSLSRLMNHDVVHKPWDKSNKFDLHIAPQQHKFVSLKYERSL